MENKFKVGDRVVVQSDEHHKRHIGAIGTVKDVWGEVSCQVVIDNQDDGFDWHFSDDDLSHYGQTLADLNVKAGDVVEMVGGLYSGHQYKASDCGKLIDMNSDGEEHYGYWDRYNSGLFRIISRASDAPQWKVCEPDYTPQDNHEVSYHMGVATHWREVEAKEVDVERRVNVDREFDMYVTQNANATLRGKTLNGKPVGQWVIDMD